MKKLKEKQKEIIRNSCETIGIEVTEFIFDKVAEYFSSDPVDRVKMSKQSIEGEIVLSDIIALVDGRSFQMHGRGGRKKIPHEKKCSTISVSLTPEIRKKLEIIAKKQKTTIGSVCFDILKKYTEKKR